jgi:hypothetical protein
VAKRKTKKLSAVEAGKLVVAIEKRFLEEGVAVTLANVEMLVDWVRNKLKQTKKKKAKKKNGTRKRRQ